MFERYTEQGRRSIFFARFEASQLGLQEITTDCLLLGVLREDNDIAVRWLAMATLEACEAIARKAALTGKRLATNVDMPISNGGKRVLANAAGEADLAANSHIGTEHLFLGMLREAKSFAAQRLKERGITIEEVRAALVQDPGSAVKTSVRGEIRSARGQQVILELEDGSEVAAINWTGRVPSAGESIRLAVVVNGSSVFRVLDVQWRVRNMDDAALPGVPFLSQITSVLLTVRPEPV